MFPGKTNEDFTKTRKSHNEGNALSKAHKQEENLMQITLEPFHVGLCIVQIGVFAQYGAKRDAGF